MKLHLMVGKKKILCLILLISYAGFSQEGEKKENPIEVQLQKCLDIPANHTTAGMCDCVFAAEKAWDKELNKYYKLLMDKLPAAEKQQLKEAQRKWLEYRDAEMKLKSGIFGTLNGTMWQNISAGRSMQIVQQRAEELEEYYELLTNYGE
jgi:uncharacterized protein YecT (DUF1311 family)